MPKIEYEVKKFREATLVVIQQANDILTEYRAQGFVLTLRQLYYQFVSRAFIPNTDRDYKRLGNTISDARRAGLVDWASIIDRTRNLVSVPNWANPSEILQSAVDSYHRDLWDTQDNRLEVWIEKDALIGVIEDICRELDVPYFSCRGYVSDSEMWSAAARRMTDYADNDQNVVVLHLGDHDPSGIDMTRDIRDRLSLFSGSTDPIVKRIALTMEQVDEQGPPPNPAKVTDSRYESYQAVYGDESWELDALEPQFMADLIREHVEELRDDEAMDKAVAEQEAERQQIQDVIDKWGKDDEDEDDDED